MSLRAKWQNLRKRSWGQIRDAWLTDIPSFAGIGTPPDPGLERLAPLLALDHPKASIGHVRLADVAGLRTNALSEAVFLFHKCSHTHLAAQRIGQQGMQSWCLFNAYHSAYLGARGLLTLLGAPLPNLAGRQVVLDLFPEPINAKTKGLAASSFNDFVLIPLPGLDQRQMWEGLQRVLRMTEAPQWSESVRDELLSLSFEKITPPRNHFLYKAHFWPIDDLAADDNKTDFSQLYGPALDTEEPGFLLRLGFCTYLLFEQLMLDLAAASPVIAAQVSGSRCVSDPSVPELGRYRSFLATVEQTGTAS
jgi:hypothetical protein